MSVIKLAFVVSPDKEVFLKIVLKYAEVIQNCGESSCADFILLNLSNFLLVNKQYIGGTFKNALAQKYRELTLANKKYQEYYEELFGHSISDDRIYNFADIRECIHDELKIYGETSTDVKQNKLSVETEEPCSTNTQSFHECKVDKEGTKEYFNEKGKLHRIDGPAVVWADGDTTERLWWVNGKLHRTDGPAIDHPKEGIKEWYFEGKKVEPMFHECKVDEYGAKRYFNEKGENHHTHGPAIVYSGGAQEWYQNNKPHRTGGPAIEYSGYKAWWQNGKLHRTDGPAVEGVNGHKEWYLNGDRHRTDGPAIEWADGYKMWYQNGELHRTDGPAVVWADGDTTERLWWVNGKRHRTDGPAIDHPKEGKKKWYFEGREVEPMFHECKVDENGTKEYFNEKERLHHTHGPAVQQTNGFQAWHLNGELHREDGPAVEWEYDVHWKASNMEWWTNGQRNRENDLPAIKWKSGAEEWWKNGERHRDPKCGPAVIDANTSTDRLRVQCHRFTDKYMAYYSPGNCEWWVHDKKLETRTIGILAKEPSTIIQKLSEYKNYRVVDDIVLQFIDSQDHSVKKSTLVYYIDADITEKELFENYIAISKLLFDEGKPKVRPVFIYSSGVSEDIKSSAKAYSPNTYEENDIDSILSAIKSI